MVMKIEVFDEKFQAKIAGLLTLVDDLTIPFKLIIQSWYRSNLAIFNLGGPGKYVDLKKATKAAKIRLYGSAYPILQATGRLKDSITDPSSPDGIAMIINRKSLTLGTKVPYGGFLQYGTKFMPARPFILLGPEQVSPPGINNRREVWLSLLQNYVNARVAQLNGI
jgi:phage gpG-like protein